jgi:ribosome-associated protein
MLHRSLTASLLQPELEFSASRSSGPGGQNVNKVNSKITLRFNIVDSHILTAEEKEVLLRKLASKLSGEGVLIIIAQDSRSQVENKTLAGVKLEQMLAKAFEKKKVRKATKPSKSAVRKRVDQKKKQSEKKQWRQKPQ